MKKIVGNVIVLNGFPEILRCLDSLSKVCEEIYIVDGGSTDGTYEWLESVKEVYNLHLFQRKFDNHRQQRDFILQKTPKDVWVITLDADESLTLYTEQKVQGLIDSLEREQYLAIDRDVIMSIPMWCFHLYPDRKHFTRSGLFARAGYIFYNSDGVKWGGHDFHSKTVRNGEDSYYKMFDGGQGLGFLHWAFVLGKDKFEARKNRLEKWKDDHEKEGEGAGEWNFYIRDRDKHVIEELPPGL